MLYLSRSDILTKAGETMQQNDRKSFLKYLFATLLFGSNGIVASHIALSSYEIVLFRTLLGSLFLVALYLLTGGKFHTKEYRRDFIYVALSGLAMGASWMFLYEGYQEIGVGMATLLYYTGPVFVMILTPVIFKEKLTAPKVIGFAVVFVGIILINGISGGQRISAWGLICALFSALTYTALVILNKQSKHIVGMENAAIQLCGSFIVVAVFVGIKEHFAFAVVAADWPWILLLGVVNTGIGCYLYFSSLSKLSVQTIAICGYMEPLSAVLLAALLLSERMSPIQIVGAVCIIGGAMLGELLDMKKKTTA